MNLDRRQFLLALGAAASTRSFPLDADTPEPTIAPSPFESSPDDVPWHQKIRRVGQVNFNERDPAELDVTAWADTWADLKADAVLVSVTGIIAFYPTSVPHHRRSQFLGNRDLFGECCAAAKKRGMRVIARYSPDLIWDEALAAHPEWFRRDAAGKPVAHAEVPGLFNTCPFSTYFTEQMPGHHARDQRALRRGRHLHQRVAEPRRPAGVPLRAVSRRAGVRHAGISRAAPAANHRAVEALHRHRAREAPRQHLLRQSRLGHTRADEPARRSRRSASGSTATIRVAAARTHRPGAARSRAASRARS